jgi:hypothetical protein
MFARIIVSLIGAAIPFGVTAGLLYFSDYVKGFWNYPYCMVLGYFTLQGLYVLWHGLTGTVFDENGKAICKIDTKGRIKKYM